MNLIIVESPTKARTLSRFLGSNFSVEATMGHIMDLPKEKLSVDVENNFKPQYIVVEKRKDSINKIKDLAEKAERLYIATDPDREGEAIASHVKDILQDTQQEKRDKGVLRVSFHEITKDAVEHAIDHPRGIDKNLVDAQIARRVLDRLVGYKLSPLLWKKVRRGLSAGRVQSVAVRLIVEREKEIQAFVPEEYWEIWANVKCQKPAAKCKPFDVKLVKIGDRKAEVKNKKEADRVQTDLKKAVYKVFNIKQKEVNKSPYPPFTTSTMTQTGSKLFAWSAKKTMSIAQRLYEEGLITYHRTDSVNLASTAIVMVRNFVKKNYGDSYLPESPRYFKKASKLAQEAHEAIRPTNVGLTSDKLRITDGKFINEAKTLYEIIWKRFVACQMANSIFDETVIDVLATRKMQNAIEYLLRASGQVLKFDGWRKVIPLSKKDEPQLPPVNKDEVLNLIKIISEQKFTQPPARYNEASLIKTLEKLGIGRPSTYAPIITTIQIRNYVEKEEGKFKPTPVGVAVNEFLVKNFSNIVDYSFTADMENNLDDVAKGEQEWQRMMKQFYTPFEKKLGRVEEKAKRVKIEAEKLGKKCPKCGKGEQVIRVGRFGKFISCSRFPDCDFKAKYEDRVGIKCPDCKEGNVVVKKSRRGRKFYGCSRYPDCEFASWKKPKTISEN